MDGSLVTGQIRWKFFSHPRVYGLSNGWTGLSLAEIEHLGRGPSYKSLQSGERR